jgi:hypothetical protein
MSITVLKSKLCNSRVDGLERSERERDLLLLAFLVQDGSNKDTKTIIGDCVSASLSGDCLEPLTSVEELEFLLGRRDSRQDRQSSVLVTALDHTEQAPTCSLAT